MNIDLFKMLVMNEVRLRLRRTSTLVALLAVTIISWAMIGDPAKGDAVIVINDARVLYTSNVIAIGSGSLAGLLFGLGGFYLVRGRSAEDARSGAGSVIGAAPISNLLFLASRWAGGVAYLGSLMLAFMVTMLGLHLVRGDGPIELLVYLQFYALLLLPLLFFTVSCAVLFDSVAFLMGKAGDVLYFILFCAQLGAAIAATAVVDKVIPLATVFDFSGVGACMLLIREGVDSTAISLGGGSFNPKLASIELTGALWTAQMVALRCISGVLALLPLLPAIALFHRFSPDRVKLSTAAKRRSPLDVLNGWLRPLARLVQPLFRLAARVPGMGGQVLADVALTLAQSPSGLAAALVLSGLALVLPAPALGPLLMVAGAWWGVLVCDLSTRDFEAGTEDMTGAVNGGALRRYARQYAATALLGFAFTAMIALRWSFVHPVGALAVVTGVLGMAALASLFGRCARTPRLFLALFLFWKYIEFNKVPVPLLDAFGAMGIATPATAAAYGAIAVLALAGGYWWNRRAQ
jgi:hypothetical protein